MAENCASCRSRPTSSRVLIPLLMGLLAAPSLASGHGVYHQVTQKEAVLVTAEYDDGEPMSYAEVKVTSPSGGKVAHQTGRTDKNGCFAFVPDCEGEWKVTIDGEMGHLVEATVTVNETLLVQKNERVGGAPSKWQGIAVGFGIIFGLAGFMYGLRMHRLRHASPQPDRLMG